MGALTRSLWATVVAATVVTLAQAASAPEDLLKGQLLASALPFPTRWANAEEYASRLKKLHQPTLTYDKEGKLPIGYAAFFASQVSEPVSLVVYDITEGVGRKVKKASSQPPVGKGSRALFGKYTLTQTELPANRNYMLVVETMAGKALASGNVALR